MPLASLPFASRARVRRSRGLGAVAVGGLLAAASFGVSAASAKAPAPTPCPPVSRIAQTLKQKIVKTHASVVSYSDGQGVDGARRTCEYTTSTGGVITVQLNSGAQILAFVDAEDSATDLPTGYGNHSHVTAQIVPIFGIGNDAWALKARGPNPAVLSALYHTRSIVISAPRSTIPQMAALAKATLGIPSPDQKDV